LGNQFPKIFPAGGKNCWKKKQILNREPWEKNRASVFRPIIQVLNLNFKKNLAQAITGQKSMDNLKVSKKKKKLYTRKLK